MSGINWSQKKLEELKNKRAVDQLNLKNEASRVQGIIQEYYTKKRETEGLISFAGSLAGAWIGKSIATPATGTITDKAEKLAMKIGGGVGGGIGSILGSIFTPKGTRVKKAILRGQQNSLMPYLSEDLIREEDKTLSSVFLGAQKGYSRGGDLQYWKSELTK